MEIGVTRVPWWTAILGIFASPASMIIAGLAVAVVAILILAWGGRLKRTLAWMTQPFGAGREDE